MGDWLPRKIGVGGMEQAPRVLSRSAVDIQHLSMGLSITSGPIKSLNNILYSDIEKLHVVVTLLGKPQARLPWRMVTPSACSISHRFCKDDLSKDYSSFHLSPRLEVVDGADDFLYFSRGAMLSMADM